MSILFCKSEHKYYSTTILKQLANHSLRHSLRFKKKMLSLNVLFIILSITSAIALHLSPEQMYSARGLLMKPNLSPGQRIHVQKLLYKSHEKWAIKKSVEFKQMHSYKCADISIDELVLCGKMGLFKSSKNYNGQSSFTKYAEIYVKSELLRVMTSRLKGAIFNEIAASKSSTKTKPFYKSLLKSMDAQQIIMPELVSSNHPLNIRHYNLLREAMWQHINKQDGFTQRIFCYKYDFDFAQIRSNLRVAELMSCSEETVRKTIQRENDNLRKMFVQNI